MKLTQFSLKTNTISSMHLPNKSTSENILYAIILLLLVLIAGDILWRATTGDTTLLGDPYYEDTILANSRALPSLVFTWTIVALCLVLAIIGRKR